MKNLSSNTKKGVASLYIVIFATMLFGVITLSCMRIMLSEFGQSSDDDLSRSAYDAAMAGVEDAKTAVNRYYDCLGGAGKPEYCNTDARDSLFAENCDTSIGVAKYLYGNSYNSGTEKPEVMLQEGSDGTNRNDNNSNQAYTCVIVSDETPDYRGTLTSDTNTKVVPLGVKSVDGGSSGLGRVRRVKFSWYSQLNEGDASQLRVNPDGKFMNSSRATLPPTISLTIIKIGDSTSADFFHKANNGADYSTVVLVPGAIGPTNTNTISHTQLETAGNAIADKHESFTVQCSLATEFACSVDLTGLSFGNNDSAFLVVSLPYRELVTDFAVALYESEDVNAQPINFKGVQISVDSTGRTDQLFRRVETRLDPSDMYFPFPQYALDLGNGGDGALTKDFWITANCWYARKFNDNFDGGACKNNNNY